jgi:LysM repeat protein
LLLCAWLMTGCLPSGRASSDEEREPHFLEGRALVSSMDYGGGIQAFEKALQVNPNSAAAHFELAWLYEEKSPDPSAAIYHYRCYLRLRPKAQNVDMVEKHIGACKVLLARSVSLGPVSAALQADYERLDRENKQLQQQLAQSKAEILRLAAATNPPPVNPPSGSQALFAAAGRSANPGPTPPANSALSSGGSASAGTPKRSYTVKAGDTPVAIAKHNGLRVDALMAANPGLDARRLRVGQILSLP